MPKPFKTFSEAKQEEIFKDGVGLCHENVAECGKPNYTKAVSILNEKYNTNVDLGTLQNHFLGQTKSRREGHVDQQFLSPVQENILIEWIILLADSAHAISKWTVHKKAELLCGKKPGTTWVHTFLK